MAKLSEITTIDDVTANDLILITDHETGQTRVVKFEDFESSLTLGNFVTAIDGGVYAS